MRKPAGSIAALVATGALLCLPAAASPERGRLLYENHCMFCHVSVVHVRSQRKAANATELRASILRWSAESKVNWQEEDVNDVYQYLNNRYYRFPPATPAR